MTKDYRPDGSALSEGLGPTREQAERTQEMLVSRLGRGLHIDTAAEWTMDALQELHTQIRGGA